MRLPCQHGPGNVNANGTLAGAAQPPNDQSNNTRSAVSGHVGGVQATLVDGSVRFVSNNVDFLTYRSMFTRAGGEVGSLSE